MQDGGHPSDSSDNHIENFEFKLGDLGLAKVMGPSHGAPVK